MGNQIAKTCNKDTCPTHPDQSIQKICLCQQCLQPLCELCVNQHYKIHERLGYPAKIQKYEKIYSEYNRTREEENEEEYINETTSTSLVLKEMTVKYFKMRQNSEQYKVKKILTNLQVWKELNNDPFAQKYMKRFLTENLKANKAVLGQYSHLYNNI